MNFFSKKKRVMPLVASLALLMSCLSVNLKDYDHYEENALFNEIQKKQQACTGEKAYKNVISLYQYYIDRFPERKDRVMEARYEIGYIHYFLKNYDEAEAVFRSIIVDFEQGAEQYAMQWIRVLSVKLRDEIVAIKTKKILETQIPKNAFDSEGKEGFQK